MFSLSPKEVEVVTEWAREELTKSLKVPAAFDIFQGLIQNGEINIPTISRKLAFKLGSKNGQFLTRLQKFIKTLQKEGAESINIQEHKEIYQISLREKKSKETEEPPIIEQEIHTVTEAEPNKHGATQISKTVFSTGDNKTQKSVLVTISFDDKAPPSNPELPPNPEIGDPNIESEPKPDEKESTPEDRPKQVITDIDNDLSSDDNNIDGDNSEPLNPQQQFLEAHRKFIFAREEARFRINQKINYNINAPKVTFQPMGWQNLFTLAKSSSEDEEEEVVETVDANILVDDETPFSKVKKDDGEVTDSKEGSKHRKHNEKHRKSRH